MLFYDETTWNEQSWEVDAMAEPLIGTHKIRDFIIGGIWNNNSKRHAAYFPQKVYWCLNEEKKQNISDELREKDKTDMVFTPLADAYLKFMVTQLKPFIDVHFKAFCPNLKNIVFILITLTKAETVCMRLLSSAPML